MTDSTVSAMTAASTLDGTELYYGVQGGADRKVTGAQIKTLVSASPTLVTPALGTPASGTMTNVTGLPLTTGVTGVLPVANGGTGTTSPGIVAGTNVTVTGTWPNQTVAASGGGGGSITPLVVGTNLVSQVNSTSSQTFNIYGTSDNTGVPTTNYSRLRINHTDSTGAIITTEKGGTGSGGPIQILPTTDVFLGRSNSSVFFGQNTPYSGTADLMVTNSGVTGKFAGLFGWASGNDAGAGPDTGVGRNAQGIVEVNNGSYVGFGGALRDLIARNVRTNPTTVASLTAASTAGAGARSFVTDATATTFGTTVAGSGSNSVPVYSDGTNWKIG